MKSLWNKFNFQQHTEQKRCYDEDTGFNLEAECSGLNQDSLSKLQKLENMGYKNKKLNFLKLNIYNWNLVDVIQFYEKDKFCLDYSVGGKCKNMKEKTMCKYEHNTKTCIYASNNSWTDDQLKYTTYICEYLLSLPQYCKNSRVCFHYARAQELLGNLDRSEQLYLATLKLDPQNATAHTRLGYHMVDKNDMDKAQKHFEAAIQLKPTDDECYGNMAHFLCHWKHHYQQSLKYSRKAAQLKPNEGDYTFLMGNGYYHTRELSLAKMYYTKTLKLGNATKCYDFNKEVVESRIEIINMRLNSREKSDKLWNEIMNGKDKIKNDKKSQVEFIISCFDAKMTFSQLLFMINKFGLSKSILNEAIHQSQAKHARENEEKSNESSEINQQLEQLQTSVWTTITRCFGVMSQIHNADSGDTTSWKHKVLNELLDNDTASTKHSNNGESSQSVPTGTTGKNSYSPMPREWENDSINLGNLCNGDDDLNLSDYFETLKSIETQERRINDQLYTNIARINKVLYENKKLTSQLEKTKENCKTNIDVARQTLEKAQKENQQLSKKFHEYLDQLVKTQKSEANAQAVIKDQQRSLVRCESSLVECGKKREELNLCGKQYQDFEESNRENIKNLNEKYDCKWKQFEKIWYNWKIPEISLYLKYKLIKMGEIQNSGMNDNHDNHDQDMKHDLETNNIDWNLFEKNLKQEKFKSKYLQMVDKSELKSFGIDNYSLRNSVYIIIKNLCKNNPIPQKKEQNDDDDENDDCEGQVMTSSSIFSNINNIDSKYLCPLTKKVMINPVIAFDEQCYEKDAIIKYINKYKESPITKEKIDDVELIIQLLVENKSLKHEIQQKQLL